MLHSVLIEHRDRFAADSWGPMYWEHGIDTRPSDELDPDAVIDCPGIWPD